MAVTRRDLLNLDNALAELEHLPASPAFALWISDAREVLAEPVVAMRNRGLVPNATATVYADYESARIELGREHAKKDAHGHPVQDTSGNFVITDHGAFEAAINVLRQDDRWREAYDAVAAQKDEWNAWMDDAAADTLVARVPSVAMADLPKTLTAGLITPLKPFLLRPAPAPTTE